MGFWCGLRDAFRGESPTGGRARDVHGRIRAVVFTVQPLMPDDAALGAQWRERIDMLVAEDMDSLLREGEEALWLEILCSNLDEYDIPMPTEIRAELIVLCRLIGADTRCWPHPYWAESIERGVKPVPATREQVGAATAQSFPDEDAATIMEILDLYGVEAYERERAQLAILKLSAGDVDQLLSYVQAAKMDYRDVLWWAEYPDPDGPRQGPPEETEALLEWLRGETRFSRTSRLQGET